jgi:hypothetical protein
LNCTIGDGFKLGCGLLLAGAFGAAVLVLLWALAIFLSGLLGFRLGLPFG